MNIKNKEIYRLAKQLSKLTGESLTTAVFEAVRERLDRVHREHGVDLARTLVTDWARLRRTPQRALPHLSISRAASSKGHGLDFLWSVVPHLSAK